MIHGTLFVPTPIDVPQPRTDADTSCQVMAACATPGDSARPRANAALRLNMQRAPIDGRPPRATNRSPRGPSTGDAQQYRCQSPSSGFERRFAIGATAADRCTLLQARHVLRPETILTAPSAPPPSCAGSPLLSGGPLRTRRSAGAACP